METKDILQLSISVLILGAVLYSLRKGKIKVEKSGASIIDSCGLIDGRIVEIIQAGFLYGTIIVPTFVVRELQLLADGNDAHKRERARFGLDTVKQLQSLPNAKVELIDDGQKTGETDARLVSLAKKYNARLYTTDFNLNKVAVIDSIIVLNINELAQSIRQIALPGEKKQVKLLQRGSSGDQAVGYLEDGTMIVVEQANRQIGRVVDVEISRVIQTVAGKMFFAKLVNSRQPQGPKTNQQIVREKINKPAKINKPRESTDIQNPDIW